LKDTLIKIIKLGVWPILGQIFHPAYLIINARTFDRLGPDYLAGFGLASLTLGALAISVGVCFSMTVGTLVSQAYGAKDLRLCRVYLNRQYYLNFICFLILCIPIAFINKIYLAIG